VFPARFSVGAHPRVLKNYGSAHEIALWVGKDEATTDNLKAAMGHYRTLFDELARVPAIVERRP